MHVETMNKRKAMHDGANDEIEDLRTDSDSDLTGTVHSKRRKESGKFTLNNALVY